MSSTFGPSAHIYYTLDGSQPDFTAPPYSGAFTLTNSATIRAIAYNSAYTDWAEAAPIRPGLADLSALGRHPWAAAASPFPRLPTAAAISTSAIPLSR